MNVRANVQATPSTTLRGRSFTFVRAAWVLVVALSLGMFILSIPGYAHEFDQSAYNTLRGRSIAASAELVFAFELVAAFASAGSTLTSFTLASLLFVRKPDDRMALFVSFFLLLYRVGNSLGRLETLLPGAVSLAWGAESLSPILMLTLLVLFPDGRFVPRWTRWLALFSTTWIPLALFLPYWWADMTSPVLWVGGAFWLLTYGTALYSQVYRYRYVSDPTQRQQTKWLILGISLQILVMMACGVPFVLYWSLPSGASLPWWFPIAGAVWSLSMSFVPVALTIAVIRYRLWDIDIIINRTLVYGSLTAMIVATYILIVGGLGSLFHTPNNLPASLLATGVIAATFQPMRLRLQRAVNHLMFGKRDEPLSVLGDLGKRLEMTIAPDAVLPNIVETVAGALKLPYVAIEVTDGNDDFRIVTEDGKFAGEAVRFPLIHHGEVIGHLVAALRGKDEPLNAADRLVLENIAHQASAAVHATRLTADLQESRERLVMAREEERRRLRRDLHDGLGPALATLSLQAEAARDLIHSDLHQSEILLNEVIAGTQAAIADIRRVVYALRPPALDDLGLISALKEQTAQYAQSGLHITLDAPDTLPSLPAAVEVAAYRIMQEALTNVVHHAQAHTCTVRLRVNGALELEIRDDGRGIPEAHRAGVGLNSMHERAAELGGTCEIRSALGSGTCIHVTLPHHLG